MLFFSLCLPQALSHKRPPWPVWLIMICTNASSIRFPFNGFTYFLTLFSKFFSSFPHGTCSLSVSCPYLALDEIYHPFWAAFPNNPTLWKCNVYAWIFNRVKDGILTLYDTVFQRIYTRPTQDKHPFSLQRAMAVFLHGAWKLELFPLHSPLLGESLLVSFPPLINMLKFSGQPCLS